MLVSIKEVANRLKISNRAVQINCQKQGILKIGNQYQITDEITQKWYNTSYPSVVMRISFRNPNPKCKKKHIHVI
jgi:hypothetical protein